MPCDLRRIVPIAQRHGLPVIEDAACAIGSEILWNGRWERIGRPHGDVACFSFHPRKVISTGDGGMLTTRHAEWDRAVPPAAPARDERARHGAARLEPGDLRGVPDGRLQLPDDRHPGGRRPRAAEAPAGDRRSSGGDWPHATRRCSRTSPGLALPGGAGLGALELAELLRAPADGLRPARGDAGDARRRRQHAPRHHVQPPRAGLRSDVPLRHRCRTRSRRRTAASCCPCTPR